MKVEPIRDKDLIRECLIYLDNKNPRNKILFGIGIYTGLRVSDILSLRVKDVYNKSRIQVKQKKTGNYVYIPINLELKRMIKIYVDGNLLQPYEFLIRSRNGLNKAITRNQAYNILNEMALNLGIENVGTHTMRKTAGFHLYYASGKDIGLVMQILGQRDQGSTLRYIGITDMDIEKSIKKLSFL